MNNSHQLTFRFSYDHVLHEHSRLVNLRTSLQSVPSECLKNCISGVFGYSGDRLDRTFYHIMDEWSNQLLVNASNFSVADWISLCICHSHIATINIDGNPALVNSQDPAIELYYATLLARITLSFTDEVCDDTACDLSDASLMGNIDASKGFPEGYIDHVRVVLNKLAVDCKEISEFFNSVINRGCLLPAEVQVNVPQIQSISEQKTNNVPRPVAVSVLLSDKGLESVRDDSLISSNYEENVCQLTLPRTR